ncbi:hypothetical protein D1007_48608 [Hordeum vulgare]|nr:hypothetical protein D1007_48608 [Hordeum vulgare]
MDFTPPRCSLGIDRSEAEQPIDPMPIAFAFLAGMITMMAYPNIDGREAVKFAEPLVQDMANVVDFTWQLLLVEHGNYDAINRKSLCNQSQPSFGAPDVQVSNNVVKSASPDSVRQVRVVHP